MRGFRAIIARDGGDVEAGTAFTTEDGRAFPAGAFVWRTPPLTVMAQTVTPEFGGHAGAFVLGRADTITREGEFIVAVGELDDEGMSEEADTRRDTLQHIESGALNGVSVDPAGCEYHWHCVTFDEEEGWCTEEVLVFDSYTIGAFTVVNIPAIDGTLIELDPPAADSEQSQEMMAAHAEDDAVAATAAATLEHPPVAWFEMPEPDELTAFTVLANGQVFGHLSPRDVCHIGMPGCQTQWASPTEFSYFHLCGPVRAANPDGSLVAVRVGPVSGSGGHYTTEGEEARNWRAAQAVYDDPRTCAAFVTAINGEHGTWVRGALRQGATQEQIAFLRDFPPSGDWRRIDGQMELVGATSVNVPGFPNLGRVSMVASGAPGEANLEPVAAIIGIGRRGRCSDCGGEHETTAHAATASGRRSALSPTAVDERLARIEGQVSIIAEAFEPEVRERLRARMRAQ